jgi:4'-phosphopantetheinyl transferase
LPPGDVHVWRASLDRPEATTDRLFLTLAPDEMRRARRFHFLEDRHHYIAGRGILRALLGAYLGRPPSELSFGYNAFGKPVLAGEPSLRFNLSHSRGLALYAVAWGREVGVDVEHVRPDFAGEAIARRFFSAPEVAALKAVPIELRVVAFFDCWTRKEAYIKARGKGLAIPLDRFDVALTPGTPAAVLDDRDAPEEKGRWTLQGLAPGPGFAGALAVEGAGWGFWCGQWPEEDAVTASPA